MVGFYVSHTSKHNNSALTGIGVHNQRSSEKSSNLDIDKSKSEENYDLHNEEPISYRKEVNKIIEEGYKAKSKLRDNSVKMVSTVVSASPSFFEEKSKEEIKEYFEINYEYLKWKVGEKNVVSATVHMDEKTPHMHFCSVPITHDGRLSAKELFDRNKLRDLQSEPVKILQEKFPDLMRGNKVVKEKERKIHLSTKDFKNQEAQKQREKVEKINLTKSKLEVLEKNIKQTEYKPLKDMISIYKVNKKFLVEERVLEPLFEVAKETVKTSEQNENLSEKNKTLIANQLSNSNEYLKVLEREKERNEYIKKLENEKKLKEKEFKEKLKETLKEKEQLEYKIDIYTKRLTENEIDTFVPPKPIKKILRNSYKRKNKSKGQGWEM